MKRAAVFLDRDGVLNRAVVRDGKPYPPQTLAELEGSVTAAAPACLRRLQALGFLLIVVTNQPDVANGKQTRAAVEAMNNHLCSLMPIHDVFVCYHDNRDDCLCRKPKPGMLVDAAARHGVDLAASFMVGDRFRDVEAGQAAGCRRSIWIDCGYREPQPKPPFERVGSLEEATAWIVAQSVLPPGTEPAG